MPKVTESAEVAKPGTLTLSRRMSYIQVAGSAGRGFCLLPSGQPSCLHWGGEAGPLLLHLVAGPGRVTQARGQSTAPFPERVVPKVPSGPDLALSTQSGPVLGPKETICTEKGVETLWAAGGAGAPGLSQEFKEDGAGQGRERGA